MGVETPLVGILCGSASDLPVMEQATAILERFEIPHELNVISAHRNPDQVDEYTFVLAGKREYLLLCRRSSARQADACVHLADSFART